MQRSEFGNAIPLFRFQGIQVYIHWSWFIMAAVLVQMRVVDLKQTGFEALVDILAVFGIVLLHEFGHALACRSVGGRADTIVLWPLGGVAFVQPPPRPGAFLWSLAAGPLVNVLLIPVTLGAVYLLGVPVMALLDEEVAFGQLPRAQQFALTVAGINFILLVFNMLPVYPLDGGQILQSLLWFLVGRTRSLMIAAGIGLVFAVTGLVICIGIGAVWLAVMAGFLAWQAYIGLRTALALARMERMSRDNPWLMPRDLVEQAAPPYDSAERN